MCYLAINPMVVEIKFLLLFWKRAGGWSDESDLSYRSDYWPQPGRPLGRTMKNYLLIPGALCIRLPPIFFLRWRSSMEEQLICNQQVGGSSPLASFLIFLWKIEKLILDREDRGSKYFSVAHNDIFLLLFRKLIFIL